MAGWIGVPLAAFALYGGLALLLQDGATRPSSRRAVVAGRGPRWRAISARQVERAEREPRVRRQL